MKSRIPLMWKWSLRDMRERWIQVVGISLIIALGVALASALSSNAAWRLTSFDRSYDILEMYDLKLMLTPGSYLDADQLTETVRSIPHKNWIEDVETRLLLSTSVDASGPDDNLFVSGQIIGVDVSNGGPHVNKLHITAGRALAPSDADEPVCVMEHNFATARDLGPGDRKLRVAGGFVLDSVGTGISAEHFMVFEEGSGLLGAMAQDRFAALFVPLGTAQQIAGLPGAANQALITTVAGVTDADLEMIQGELQQALGQSFPDVGMELEAGSDNLVRRALYDDIASDQALFDFVSFFLLLGAATGAFILVSRIVDAQRREVGVSMALGVAPWRIARRYLLIGAQIALLGTILGVVLALLINPVMSEEITKILPLPYFDSSFQVDVFAQAALVGIVIPFLAVLYPVWRAVRVAPVDAIHTGYQVAKGGGPAALMAHISMPGSSFTLFPVRNLSRGLRRTAMTVLGLAMAIMILIAVIGMIDTLIETLDVGRQEVKGDAPNRTLVTLDDFYPVVDLPTSAKAQADGVAQSVPMIVLPGELVGEQTFEAVIHVLDLDNELWHPTVTRGGMDANGPGILINEKAARDLGADIGDTVILRHPFRQSQHAWTMTETPVMVMGIHADILRMTVYVDAQHSGMMNLDGVVNGVQMNPAAGVEAASLQRTLAQSPEVTSAQRASAGLDAVADLIDQYIGTFRVLQFIVLIIAFLIAYNTTRSNIEERRRDLATMFAFGTRVRTVVRMTMIENFLIGVLGTALGIALGWLVLSQTMMAMFEHDAPELSVTLSISTATLGWAALIGVVVVTVTPVFLTRRLIKMDIPSTLRVIE